MGDLRENRRIAEFQPGGHPEPGKAGDGPGRGKGGLNFAPGSYSSRQGGRIDRRPGPCRLTGYEITSVEDSKRRLIWHGIVLFLLGLLTGFAEQQFYNPRMRLAAHLDGAMNGTFLIAWGAVWTEARRSPRLRAGAYRKTRCMARTGIGRRPRGRRFLTRRAFRRFLGPATALCRGRSWL